MVRLRNGVFALVCAALSLLPISCGSGSSAVDFDRVTNGSPLFGNPGQDVGDFVVGILAAQALGPLGYDPYAGLIEGVSLENDDPMSVELAGTLPPACFSAPGGPLQAMCGPYNDPFFQALSPGCQQYIPPTGCAQAICTPAAAGNPPSPIYTSATIKCHGLPARLPAAAYQGGRYPIDPKTGQPKNEKLWYYNFGGASFAASCEGGIDVSLAYNQGPPKSVCVTIAMSCDMWRMPFRYRDRHVTGSFHFCMDPSGNITFDCTGGNILIDGKSVTCSYVQSYIQGLVNGSAYPAAGLSTGP